MAQQTETQSYNVIEKYDNIEIRYYPPAAKVMSKGKIGGNPNFRNLFNYISGSNSNNLKISMTTPVYMKNDKENQIMEFVLPKKFNDQEIPKPDNLNLEVYKSKEAIFASIRYTGYNDNEKQFKKIITLNKFNFKNFTHNTSIATSTMMVRKKVANRIKFTNTAICEDYFYKCRILKKIKFAYCVQKFLTKYRIRNDSLQSNKFRNFFWIWKINRDYNNFNLFQNFTSLFFISLNSIKKYGF